MLNSVNTKLVLIKMDFCTLQFELSNAYIKYLKSCISKCITFHFSLYLVKDFWCNQYDSHICWIKYSAIYLNRYIPDVFGIYCTHIIVYIVASKVCTYPCFKKVVCAFLSQLFYLIILRKTSFTKCTLKFTIKFRNCFLQLWHFVLNLFVKIFWNCSLIFW